MSDFSEDKNTPTEFSDNTDSSEEIREESTIFSNPAEHKDRKKTNAKKKAALRLACAVLAVAVLAGGVFAAVKFLPEITDSEEKTNKFGSISVLSLDASKFSEVNVSNASGNFRLYSSKQETDGQESTVWCLDGVDSSLTSSSAISNIASNAASITAERKVAPGDRPLSDFGLDNPVSTAAVSFSDGTDGYSVMIGKQSPDNTGTYLKLSNDDSVYIVEDYFASSFDFTALDLADSDSFPAAAFSGDISAYKGNSGSIEKFDKMTVSGKNFAEPVVVEPNKNEQLSSVANFIITSPSERHAANIDNLLSMFTGGVSVSGAYTFDVSAESLKKYGLDNPDAEVVMTLAGQTKYYKISVVDDEYCAVINEESKLIKKVLTANLPVATYKTEDFYNDWVCMEVINELSNYTLKTGDREYSFDIKYDKDADPQYTVTHNGKKLTASLFQDFYGEFVSLRCTDFTTQPISGEPAATVTLTYSADGSKKAYAFYKVSETKYQYTYNGKAMGKIASIAYNKLIKNVKLVSENKAVV